jgi:hypothetical protein
MTEEHTEERGQEQARKQTYEEEQRRLKARTSKIKHKIAVISAQ